jgi:broad specificity phosphatase PhoE
MKTRFIILRHGESKANKECFCGGRIDVPLTELGVMQAQAASEYLKNEKIDAFYSSPLQRANKTARIAAKPHNKAVTVIEDLREIDRGILEGVPFDEIWAKYPKEAEILFHRDAFFYIEGAETVDDATKRVCKVFYELAEKHLGETVLVGFHGTVLRCLLSGVFNVKKENVEEVFPLSKNASITYLDYENGAFKLVEYGKAEHLENVK